MYTLFTFLGGLTMRMSTYAKRGLIARTRRLPLMGLLVLLALTGCCPCHRAVDKSIKQGMDNIFRAVSRTHGAGRR